MSEKMLGVTLWAKWEPKPDYKPHPRDIPEKQTYLGSKVWRYPELRIEEHPIPRLRDDEVLIEVIFYPGLTGFPCILGHETAGVVVDAGKEAFDKLTLEKFKGGEVVCTEEMVWCGACRACADGYPNQSCGSEQTGLELGAVKKALSGRRFVCCWKSGGADQCGL